MSWSAVTGGLASICSDCICFSVSVCLLSIFVWGLLSIIAVDTVVPQDKIHPANSVSVLDSFLSRGCEYFLMACWESGFSCYSVSVLWKGSPGEGKFDESVGPTALGKRANPMCLRWSRWWWRFKCIKSYVNKNKLKLLPRALNPRTANGRITNV